jgi:hypothetical protein
MSFNDKLKQLQRISNKTNISIEVARDVDKKQKTNDTTTQLFIGPKTKRKDGSLTSHGQFVDRMEKEKLIVQSLLTHNISQINAEFYTTILSFLDIYELWNTKKREFREGCAVGPKKSNKGSCTMMGGKRKHTRKKYTKGRKSLRKSLRKGLRKNKRGGKSRKISRKKSHKKRSYH